MVAGDTDVIGGSGPCEVDLVGTEGCGRKPAGHRRGVVVDHWREWRGDVHRGGGSTLEAGGVEGGHLVRVARAGQDGRIGEGEHGTGDTRDHEATPEHVVLYDADVVGGGRP